MLKNIEYRTIKLFLLFNKTNDILKFIFIRKYDFI